GRAARAQAREERAVEDGRVLEPELVRLHPAMGHGRGPALRERHLTTDEMNLDPAARERIVGLDTDRLGRPGVEPELSVHLAVQRVLGALAGRNPSPRQLPRAR